MKGKQAKQATLTVGILAVATVIITVVTLYKWQ